MRDYDRTLHKRKQLTGDHLLHSVLRSLHPVCIGLCCGNRFEVKESAMHTALRIIADLFLVTHKASPQDITAARVDRGVDYHVANATEKE